MQTRAFDARTTDCPACDKPMVWIEALGVWTCVSRRCRNFNVPTTTTGDDQ